MKKAMKKIMAVLMAVAMLCVMAVPAFAAETKGTITIDNAVKNEDYSIYKMFSLASYEGGVYDYTVVPDWENFFKTGDGAQYITLTNGHPAWIAANEDKATTVAAFAKAALKWAQDNGIDPTKTKTANADNEAVEFDSLDLGYYLVDSSLGALCSLNTTAPTATIEEKNEKPTVDKTIVDGNKETAENSAQIGDTVSYKVTVHVKKGATNYKVCDTMTSGLTFNSNSIMVDGAALSDKIGTLSTTTSPYTFVLAFNDTYLQSKIGETIIVTYNATINAAAAEKNEQTNTVKLTYGDKNSVSTEETTTTKVYKFDLVKVDGSNNKLLDGAKFELYEAAEGGEAIKLTKVDDYTYRVDPKGAITVIETKNDKAITIIGLAGKKYYLAETDAPEGYNPLKGRQEFDLTNGSNTTNMEGTTWETGNGGVRVENYTGKTLPTTGGMGTTLFYVIGGALMIAAVVLLVTKKRMENK